MATVLSVSPMPEDHVSLSSIFDRSERILRGDSKWTLRPRATVESAIGALCHARIPLVVTERDLAPGPWRDILENISRLPDGTFGYASVPLSAVTKAAEDLANPDIVATIP